MIRRLHFILLTLLALALCAPVRYSLGLEMPGFAAGIEPPSLTEPVLEGFTASRIVINVPSRMLWVYDGDRIVKYFPVGVGKVGYMTPLGHFQVIRKVIDPGWENPYLPNGRLRLAPGEDNPLGTRWIGFYRRREGEYGMHGTDNPASVGKFSSHGCVRMKIPDAEALFEMVNLGTPVEVVYEPVLIRRQGDEVRVQVFADRFRRGMPSASQVASQIRDQYPNVRLDFFKLQAALRQPTEKPVTVGSIPQIAPSSPAEATASPSASPSSKPSQVMQLP